MTKTEHANWMRMVADLPSAAIAAKIAHINFLTRMGVPCSADTIYWDTTPAALHYHTQERDNRAVDEQIAARRGPAWAA
jgi:hypothetical protein